MMVGRLGAAVAEGAGINARTVRRRDRDRRREPRRVDQSNDSSARRGSASAMNGMKATSASRSSA
jgi:hypothetical protein